MRASFAEQKIKDFSELDRYQKKGWIYRGQREAKWALKTSLERTCNDFYKTLNKAKDLEDSIWREFRRRYHHYSVHIPDMKNGIEWLSLMQHYGAPTRLLDWTYSIYVALYFAIEKPNESEDQTEPEDYAVWAMDMEWCENVAVPIVRKCKKAWQHLNKPITEQNEPNYSRTFLQRPYLSLVYPINPFRLSERLVLQKGVFLITGDISKPFEKNLKSLRGYDDKTKLVKLRIPDRRRKKFLKKLDQRNITRANLFPGLDGFSQSLGVFPPPPPAH